MSSPRKCQAAKNWECRLRFHSLGLPFGGSRVPLAQRHQRSTTSQQFRCAAKVRRDVFFLRARRVSQAHTANGTRKWAKLLVDTCLRGTKHERIPRLRPDAVIKMLTLRQDHHLRDSGSRCAALVTTDMRSRQSKTIPRKHKPDVRKVGVTYQPNVESCEPNVGIRAYRMV
jgi:hypothetical protein